MESRGGSPKNCSIQHYWRSREEPAATSAQALEVGAVAKTILDILDLSGGDRENCWPYFENFLSTQSSVQVT